ncbi:nicotine blue oxidoreductase [Kribbella rubisoli]|uniref:Nicotine blue oxidoreductase n=1 Tax=Kribbella rubisoli TaxID=3075929 RepID=A0A4V2FX36_9ACTN|nr:nicotine blue oxidoreductase [Kribbella rubisoli]
MPVAGLVLAAGAGRRMGTPKALVHDPAGIPWVVRASRLLADAGCSPVVVVIGAAADQVRADLTTEPVQVVEATDWNEGMGVSLRAGLKTLRDLPAASGTPPEPAGTGEVVAVVVVPVDVPGLTAAAVRRVAEGAEAGALARATYHGAPGHPVLMGRAHWDGVIASARGDEGARGYLREHRAEQVECSDIADGADVDAAADLPRGHG